MKPKDLLILAAVAIISVAAPRTASADAIFDVRVDTSLLSEPLGLFFQFVDGGDTDDAHNSATITNLLLGGGVLSGAPDSGGGVAGDLGGGLTLSDSDFFSYFIQSFAPGAFLSFRLTLTTLLDAGPTPDTFAFSMLGADGFPLPTTDPSGANTLLSVFINSNNPETGNYGVELTPVDATPVPEPATLTLMGSAMAAALGRRVYRRARRA